MAGAKSSRKGPSFTVHAELDASDVRQGLAEINDAMGLSVTEINQGAELIGKAFSAISGGVKLLLSGVIAVTSAAIDYGEALAEVQTISNQAVFSTAKIDEITRGLATTYGSDITSNAKALYQTISAGTTDAAEASLLLDSAARLSIGGLTDMTTAVDALTTVVNAYRGTGLTAAEASDALFVAIRDGKTTAEELGQNIGQVAGIARQAGVAFDEVAASVAAITTNGISTETAVIQLRQILASVIKPSSEAAAEAQRLGVQFSIAGVKANGLKGLLDQITGSSRFTDESMAKLFGNVRALAGAMALTANDGAKLAEILDDEANKAGATSAAFDRMSQTMGFQTRRFEALRDAGAVALGRLTSDSAEALDGITALNAAVAEFNEVVASPEAKRAADLFYRELKDNAADLLDAYLGLSKVLRDIQVRYAFATDGFLAEAIDPNEGRIDEVLSSLADRLRQRVAEGAEAGVEEGIGPQNPKIIAAAQGLGKAVARELKSSIEEQLSTAAHEILNAGASDEEEARQRQQRIFKVDQEMAERRRAFQEAERELERKDEEEHQGAIEEMKLQIRERGTIALFDLTRDQLKHLVAEIDGLNEDMRNLLVNIADVGLGVAEQVSSTIANMMGAAVEAAVRGENALSAAGKVLGGFLKQMGYMLLQLGTAALLTTALSFIPLFQPIVGAPGQGAAAGAVAVAGGIALIAAGAALEGGGSPGASAPGGGRSGGSRGGGRDGRSQAPRLGTLDRNRSAGGASDGFVASPGAGGTIVNNYTFHVGAGAVMGTTEAGAGRALERLIKKGKRLEGAPAGA